MQQPAAMAARRGPTGRRWLRWGLLLAAIVTLVHTAAAPARAEEPRVVSDGWAPLDWTDEGAHLAGLTPADDAGESAYQAALQDDALLAGEELGSVPWYNHLRRMLEHLHEAAEVDHPSALAWLGELALFGDHVEQNLTAAALYVKRASDAGSADGLLLMGFMHSLGLGVRKDPAKALMYYTLAADDEESDAHLILGYRYLKGVGVPQSCETALRHYRLAAETALHWLEVGNVDQDPRYWLSSDGLDDDGDDEDGTLDANVQFYELAAAYGDPDANLVMGDLHLNGQHGYDMDFDLARAYYERAAELGQPAAHGRLGAMYANGWGVEPHNDTARRYFLKGVDLKDPTSMNGLAELQIASGHPTAGFMLHKLAAEQGDPEGQLRTALCYLEGVGTRQNLPEALTLFAEAARNEHPMAYYYLGFMYDHGLAVAPSCDIAANPRHLFAQYYKLAAEEGPSVSVARAYELARSGEVGLAALHYAYQAELGLPVAQHNYAVLLERVWRENRRPDALAWAPFDPQRAALLQRDALATWLLAADQGNPRALLNAADHYYYGMGVRPNLNRAMELYERSYSTFHSAMAAYSLGFIRHAGLGPGGKDLLRFLRQCQDYAAARKLYLDSLSYNDDARLPVSLALLHLTLTEWLEAAWGIALPLRASAAVPAFVPEAPKAEDGLAAATTAATPGPTETPQEQSRQRMAVLRPNLHVVVRKRDWQLSARVLTPEGETALWDLVLISAFLLLSLVLLQRRRLQAGGAPVRH